jgi:hypothetical protein
MNKDKDFIVHSKEHEYEMYFYKQLSARTKEGFFKNKQPVMFLKKYPFQFPVPSKASGGNSKSNTGHTDIIVRSNGGKCLSVIELKAIYDEHAVFQAFVYAYQIRKYLEKGFYTLFGFSKKSREVSLKAIVILPTMDKESDREYLKNEVSEINTLSIQFNIEGSVKEGRVEGKRIIL